LHFSNKEFIPISLYHFPEDSSADLGDLEDDLIDDYERLEDVDIEDIVLDGDKDDIEV